MKDPLHNQLVWHAKNGYPLTHKQRAIIRREKAQKKVPVDYKEISKGNKASNGLFKYDQLFKQIGIYISP